VLAGETLVKQGLKVTEEAHPFGGGVAQEGAPLAFEHFAEILDWKPEILLLGTGERQQFPAAALMGAMLSRRIGFEVMDSRAACRTYNVLVSEARAVTLALL
jgi:uncharacterized protein